jgi:hypothetical protein
MMAIDEALETLRPLLAPGLYEQLRAQVYAWPLPAGAPTTPPDDEAETEPRDD